MKKMRIKCIVTILIVASVIIPSACKAVVSASPLLAGTSPYAPQTLISKVSLLI